MYLYHGRNRRDRRGIGVKFIHISDVHLGVEPDVGKSWSGQRKQDIWDSFAEVISVAEREQPDFLFVTGDLFHGQPLKKELKEVDSFFRRISQTRVMLIVGNHDYLRTNSYYLSYPWAENVYVFRREDMDVYDFPECNVSVYGLSYWHREISEKKYDTYHPQNPARINVLLAHGGDERHIPFHIRQILQNGFDYVAAGHIHRGGWLAEGRAVMAGSLEPTDCNDVGPHGYWMGTLDKSGAAVHFFPIKKCEYCHECYEVCAQTTEREILSWAKDLLAERPQYQYFRLMLTGRKDPDMTFDLQKLSELPRIVDVRENIVPDYNYEKLLREYPDSILGEYIRRMNRREADIVCKKALEYGVNVLLGYEI